MEYTLLRSCLSLPKLSHCLRTCPPNVLAPCYSRFDGLMRDTLGDILGTQLDDNTWNQATLPVSLGGMGIRKASTHCYAAYAISVTQSKAHHQTILGDALTPLHLDAVLPVLNRLAQNPITEEDLAGLSQHAVSLQINLKASQGLLASTPEPRERVRLGCVALR